MTECCMTKSQGRRFTKRLWKAVLECTSSTMWNQLMCLTRRETKRNMNRMRRKKKLRSIWQRALKIQTINDEATDWRKTGNLLLTSQWRPFMNTAKSKEKALKSPRKRLLIWSSESPIRMMRSKSWKDGFKQTKKCMRKLKRKKRLEREQLPNFWEKERRMIEKWRLWKSSWLDRRRKEGIKAKSGIQSLMELIQKKNNSLLIKSFFKLIFVFLFFIYFLREFFFWSSFSPFWEPRIKLFSSIFVNVS